MFDDIFHTLAAESGTGEAHHGLHDPSSPLDLSNVDVGFDGSVDIQQAPGGWNLHVGIAAHGALPLSDVLNMFETAVGHAVSTKEDATSMPGAYHHVQDVHLSHITPTMHDPEGSHFAAGLVEVGDQIVPYQMYWNPNEFHGVGHPLEYSHYWQRQTGEDCAVMAQGEIFESFTGYHLTEQQLCQIAQEHGLYDPESGTQPQNVGKLLNLLGVQTEQRYNANLYDLANALQHNDRVIVGVNANEIWHAYRDSATGAPVELPLAGHAVWVTGIDQAPDGSIKVILCDSGTPNGQLEAVDAEDFLNAWADYGNEMVVAHQPA